MTYLKSLELTNLKVERKDGYCETGDRWNQRKRQRTGHYIRYLIDFNIKRVR